MARLLALTAVVVLSAGSAAADPPAAPPKRTQTAWLVSAAATAGGVALMVSGGLVESRSSSATGVLMVPGLALAFFGPTAGHWYADNLFTLGLGIRLAAVGGVALVGAGGCRGGCPPDVAEVILAVGGIAWLGGAIVDFALLGSSVREYNARVTLAPIVSADRRGLALVGSW